MKKINLILLSFLLIFLQNVTSNAATLSTYNRNLGTGYIGNDVKQLQDFLISKGLLNLPFGSVTYFGPRTREALSKYQSSVGISPANGYFGIITRSSLNSQITVPNSNSTTTGVTSGTPASSTVSSNFTLTANTTGLGTISGISGTSQEFRLGALVTLKAVPSTGYIFGTWSGCSYTYGNSCFLIMNSSKTVTANFIARPVTSTSTTNTNTNSTTTPVVPVIRPTRPTTTPITPVIRPTTPMATTTTPVPTRPTTTSTSTSGVKIALMNPEVSSGLRYDYLNINAAFYQIALEPSVGNTCLASPTSNQLKSIKNTARISLINRNGVETVLPISSLLAPWSDRTNSGCSYLVARVDSAPTVNFPEDKYSIKACLGSSCDVVTGIDLKKTPQNSFKTLKFSAGVSELRAFIPYTKSFLTQNGGTVRPRQGLPEAMLASIGKNGIFEPLFNAPLSSDKSYGSVIVYPYGGLSGISHEFVIIPTNTAIKNYLSLYENGNYDLKMCFAKDSGSQAGSILAKDGYDTCATGNFELKDSTGTRKIGNSSTNYNNIPLDHPSMNVVNATATPPVTTPVVPVISSEIEFDLNYMASVLKTPANTSANFNKNSDFFELRFREKSDKRAANISKIQSVGKVFIVSESGMTTELPKIGVSSVASYRYTEPRALGIADGKVYSVKIDTAPIRSFSAGNYKFRACIAEKCAETGVLKMADIAKTDFQVIKLDGTRVITSQGTGYQLLTQIPYSESLKNIDIQSAMSNNLGTVSFKKNGIVVKKSSLILVTEASIASPSHILYTGKITSSVLQAVPNGEYDMELCYNATSENQIATKIKRDGYNPCWNSKVGISNGTDNLPRLTLIQ